MSFLKLYLTLLLLFPTLIYAEIKPHIAVYDLYTKGFYIGESTQTLHKKDDVWHITLSSKTKGFASFFRSKPAVIKETFKAVNNQIKLQSSDNDPGNKDPKTISYYDAKSQHFLISKGDISRKIKTEPVIASILTLPLIASELKTKQSITYKMLDKDHLETIVLSSQGKQSINFKGKKVSASMVLAQLNGSNKKIHYFYNDNTPDIPFLIERFNGDKKKMHLELKSFK
ncbi:MAG: DUF3108 domain-containing protein [Gammaproteobacteria bacterium]|nr:DUF3108 domain-containing protein [Gammaproteobacteria bacterium]